MLLTEDLPHGIANLTQSGIGLDGSNDQRQQVRAASRAPLQSGKGLLYLFIIAPLPQGDQFSDLAFAHFGVNSQQDWSLLIFLDKAIDTHYSGLATVQGLLIIVGSLLNFCLHKTTLNSAYTAAECINLLDVVPGPLFDSVRQCFDIISTSQGLDDIGYARLIAKDLLCAQGHTGGNLGGQSKNLVL